jgi:hypothetical protein
MSKQRSKMLLKMSKQRSKMLLKMSKRGFKEGLKSAKERQRMAKRRYYTYLRFLL